MTAYVSTVGHQIIMTSQMQTLKEIAQFFLNMMSRSIQQNAS